MTRLEQIQTQYKGINGDIDLYIDGTSFYFIDVDDNRLDGRESFTLSCGCCSEFVDVDSSLSNELEYMNENEFNELISELDNLK